MGARGSAGLRPQLGAGRWRPPPTPAEHRQRALAAATRHLCLSYACVCVNARLSVRVPVHVVGESDRPNQMHSDMKYIFCEYLRPSAAREEHAVARARGRKARGFMVSPACTVD